MSDFEIYILREQTPALGIGAGTYTKGRGPMVYTPWTTLVNV